MGLDDVQMRERQSEGVNTCSWHELDRYSAEVEWREITLDIYRYVQNCGSYNKFSTAPSGLHLALERSGLSSGLQGWPSLGSDLQR